MSTKAHVFYCSVCALTLLACAPPGYEKAAFTSVNWPSADQPMSIEQRAEIEGRLRALDYLNEPADGLITSNTRGAIRSFQGDIGAPANGYVSAQLLDALRTNTAFLSNEQLNLSVQTPAPAPTSRSVAPVVPASSTSSGTAASDSEDRGGDGGGGSGGGGSGGGAGGGGGGAWN